MIHIDFFERFDIIDVINLSFNRFRFVNNEKVTAFTFDPTEFPFNLKVDRK